MPSFSSTRPFYQIAFNLLAVILFAAPVAAFGQFTYQTNNNAITITGYSGGGSHVFIPDTINGYPVVAIGNGAFYSKGIESVVFPAGLTSIGGAAFYGCDSLFSVSIPAGVTNIGDSAFRFCALMTNITVDPLNQQYSSLEGVFYDKSLTRLIQYPTGRPGTYTTPGTVRSIGDSAFYTVNSLTEAVIGGGVTNIGGWLFFQSGIKKVTFLPGVTLIPHDAFASSAVTNVVIPGTVTSIESYAFHSCLLTTLTIPASVTNIASDALSYCFLFKALLFTGNAPTGPLDFSGDNSLVIYYLPGTSGWNTFPTARPTSLWNPLFQSARAVSGQFRTEIVGTTNIPILMEASPALAGAVWQPVLNCALTNGSMTVEAPFSTSYPSYFFRVRWPWD